MSPRKGKKPASTRPPQYACVELGHCYYCHCMVYENASNYDAMLSPETRRAVYFHVNCKPAGAEV